MDIYIVSNLNRVKGKIVKYIYFCGGLDIFHTSYCFAQAPLFFSYPSRNISNYVVKEQYEQKLYCVSILCYLKM